MHNLLKRRFRKKARSCPMCKPHKMHWADQRKLSDVKADQRLREELQDAP